VKLVALLLALVACRDRGAFIYYAPTPPEVVDLMIRIADVHAGDVVYDLGCGDGRVVIAAVRAGAARGVCVDIDALKIAEAKKNAIAAGVADRIRFATADLREVDVADATVVMLYLSRGLNLRIRSKLRGTLAPGSRVVSHWHDMGDWAPAKTVEIRAENWVRPVYLWKI